MKNISASWNNLNWKIRSDETTLDDKTDEDKLLGLERKNIARDFYTDNCDGGRRCTDRVLGKKIFRESSKKEWGEWARWRQNARPRAVVAEKRPLGRPRTWWKDTIKMCMMQMLYKLWTKSEDFLAVKWYGWRIGWEIFVFKTCFLVNGIGGGEGGKWFNTFVTSVST